LLSKEEQEQIFTLINNGPTDVSTLENRLQEEDQEDIPDIIEKLLMDNRNDRCWEIIFSAPMCCVDEEADSVQRKVLV
jgi:hypothetical protein